MEIITGLAIEHCAQMDILINTETPTLKVRIDMEFRDDTHVRIEIAPSPAQETLLNGAIGPIDNNCVTVVGDVNKRKILAIINQISP